MDLVARTSVGRILDPSDGAGDRGSSGGCASPTEIEVDEVVDKSATQVTGEPSPLLLWLWGRAPDSSVRFVGDVDVAQRLREELALATQ